MNKYYPRQVMTTHWKTSTLYQICCRPDALAPLCADICVLGGMSAPPIQVTSVGHIGKDIASFLISIEVPQHIKKELLDLIDEYAKKS